MVLLLALLTQLMPPRLSPGAKQTGRKLSLLSCARLSSVEITNYFSLLVVAEGGSSVPGEFWFFAGWLLLWLLFAPAQGGVLAAV